MPAPKKTSPDKQDDAFAALCLADRHFDVATRAYSAKGLKAIRAGLLELGQRTDGPRALTELLWMARYLNGRKLQAAAEQLLQLAMSASKELRPKGWAKAKPAKK